METDKEMVNLFKKMADSMLADKKNKLIEAIDNLPEPDSLEAEKRYNRLRKVKSIISEVDSAGTMNEIISSLAKLNNLK